MVTITLHCPHCGSEALVRDGHAPNGNQKDRSHACGRRSRENPPPMLMLKLAAKRTCMPLKNAGVCAASRLRLASGGRPCRVGSKQRSSASSLVSNSARP